MPVYALLSSFAQVIVFGYGIYLFSRGEIGIGLVAVSFASYANNFYNPLRQLAALWTGFQTAMAGWDRIAQILSLETDLVKVEKTIPETAAPLLEFRDVYFGYDEDKEILHNISFKLERGKTYALVGPTGAAAKQQQRRLLPAFTTRIKGMVLLERGWISAHLTQR